MSRLNLGDVLRREIEAAKKGDAGALRRVLGGVAARLAERREPEPQAVAFAVRLAARLGEALRAKDPRRAVLALVGLAHARRGRPPVDGDEHLRERVLARALYDMYHAEERARREPDRGAKSPRERAVARVVEALRKRDFATSARRVEALLARPGGEKRQ